MLLETDGAIASAAAEGVPRDGTTDAQPMLQALLDQGRSIYLDPGDYLLRRGLETRDHHQKIFGPGWGSPGSGNRPTVRLMVYPPGHERGYLDNRRGIITLDHPHCSVRELEVRLRSGPRVGALGPRLALGAQRVLPDFLVGGLHR